MRVLERTVDRMIFFHNVPHKIDKGSDMYDPSHNHVYRYGKEDEDIEDDSPHIALYR